MPHVDVRPITVAQTRVLRSALLRPFQSPDELVYPGDDDSDSLHAGVFVGDALMGMSSVCRCPLPGDDDPDTWRLKGVAVRPEMRGEGLGRALIERCIAHARSHGGRALWCNGRTSAASFYRALGFELSGEPFEVPGTGPHYVMKRTI